jgi:hypothetical protein
MKRPKIEPGSEQQIFGKIRIALDALAAPSGFADEACATGESIKPSLGERQEMPSLP